MLRQCRATPWSVARTRHFSAPKQAVAGAVVVGLGAGPGPTNLLAGTCLVAEGRCQDASTLTTTYCNASQCSRNLEKLPLLLEENLIEERTREGNVEFS